MRLICIPLLIVTLATCACADLARLTPPDPRLDKKITLDVSHVKLEDVTKSLTEQTGVAVKAGSGSRDWKVRETTVTIHAEDVTLGKALDEIGALLGYYLSREGKAGEWSYIIWQDKKSRDLESEMLTAEKEAAAQRIIDDRKAVIDKASDALKLTPEAAMKLKEKDPMTAYLGGTKTGRAFSQILSSLGSQFATEYELMMRGKQVSFMISDLPSNLRAAVNDAVGGGLAKALQQDGAQQNLTPYRLVVTPTYGDEGDQMTGLLGMNGAVFINGIGQEGEATSNFLGGGWPMTHFPMISPDSPAASVFADMFLGIENGESLESVDQRLGPKLEDPIMLSQILAKDSPTEKQPPTDPELTREIEIKAEGLAALPKEMITGVGNDHDGQSKTLEEMSRALGWSVYFESFDRMMPLAMFVKSGKQPLYKTLVAVEKAGYKWEHGERSLRIRPENWARSRAYVIPESLMTSYRDLLRKQGEFTLDDVARITSDLTDDQIQYTLVMDKDMSFLIGTLGAGGPMTGPRDILRLYGSLTPEQKHALDTPAGLPFEEFTDAQWNRMNAIITDGLGGIYVAGGSIVLKPLTDDEKKQGTLNRTFVVKVKVQGEQEPREISPWVCLSNKQQIKTIQGNIKKMQEQAKAENQPKPQTTLPK